MNSTFVSITFIGAVVGFFVTVVLPHWWWSSPAARIHARITRRLGRRTQKRRRARGVVNPIFGRPNDANEPAWRRSLRSLMLRVGGAGALRLLVVIGGVVGTGAVFGLIHLGDFAPPQAALYGVGVGFGAAFLVFRHKQRAWATAFLENFNDAIELIIRAVRAGIPVGEAIRQAGGEVNEPVASEFRRIADSIDLGVDMRDSLRQAADRIRLPDFDFFVVCLILQRETGGQLTDTLEGLTQILRRRKEIRLKVRALTSEGRTTAIVVGALPVVTAGLMFALDPDHIMRLFQPGMGRSMLLYGICSMVLGMVVINQLSQFRA